MSGSVWSVLLLALSVLALGVCAAETATKPGDAVPDVGAVDETGKEVKLSSFKDKNGIVLFFFPKADTPG